MSTKCEPRVAWGVEDGFGERLVADTRWTRTMAQFWADTSRVVRGKVVRVEIRVVPKKKAARKDTHAQNVG